MAKKSLHGSHPKDNASSSNDQDSNRSPKTQALDSTSVSVGQAKQPSTPIRRYDLRKPSSKEQQFLVPEPSWTPDTPTSPFTAENDIFTPSVSPVGSQEVTPLTVPASGSTRYDLRTDYFDQSPSKGKGKGSRFRINQNG
jgi:hypothetical protein